MIVGGRVHESFMSVMVEVESGTIISDYGLLGGYTRTIAWLTSSLRSGRELLCSNTFTKAVKLAGVAGVAVRLYMPSLKR
jgi:hypothetical protein